MNRRRFSLTALALAACLAAPVAHAEDSPASPSLIRFDAQAGASLLISSTAREAYWPLSIHFVTQATQSYCGLASLVMVLNALGLPAPPVPGIESYTLFTQDNVLNKNTEQILPQAVLLRRGMTLDQFGLIASSFGASVNVHHAGERSIDQFREMAAAYLGRRDHHVVVNYRRRELGQERGGHISPLAAYDAGSDRFLLLDVARYKYPPVWVKASDLHAAMNTVDTDNNGQTRGFVLMASKPK